MVYIQPDDTVQRNIVFHSHKEAKKFEWHHFLEIVLGFVGFILIMIYLIRRCLIQRRFRSRTKLKRKNSTRSPSHALQIEPPVYTTQNSIYLVPFSALPPNFDYSANGVEVRSDYVIVKDLQILNIYGAICHRSLEEYQRSTPYNPNFR